MKMGNKISKFHEVSLYHLHPKHIYGNPPAYSTTTLHRLKVTQQMSAVGHTFMSAAQKVSDGHINQKQHLHHEQQCQAP
jgi:hypothetical protein